MQGSLHLTNLPKSKITATILAGGQSSRMGQDKALLPVDGVTLLTKVCQIACACANQVYVITPWKEKYQPFLPVDCTVICELPLPGETGNHGPLVGFAQGLAQVQTDWVLLLACDLPCLHEKQLHQWSPYLTEASSDVLALLPRQIQGWEPLCGFYRSKCLPLLQDFIQQGGRSFQGWLAQMSVQELPVSDPQILFNCNTPEDWKLVSTHQRLR